MCADKKWAGVTTALTLFLKVPPADVIYFKLYRGQLPVIEQTLETAARMLGLDKSRGYCLEMICADFWQERIWRTEIPTHCLCHLSGSSSFFLPEHPRRARPVAQPSLPWLPFCHSQP
jgi:hypothetical protein